MDNRCIDATGESRTELEHLLQFIWTGVPGGLATHYLATPVVRKTTYYSHEITADSPGNVERPVGGKPLLISHYDADQTMAAGGTSTLILLWHQERDGIALPYPLDSKNVGDFVAGWLANASYGGEPDHDGSNHKGFRLFTDGWGHVAGYRYGIVGVQPAWAMHGK